MSRIFSPDPSFTGTCAGLEFNGGVAECGDPFVLGFLAGKGFAVELHKPKEPVKPLCDRSTDELVEVARGLDVSLSGIRQGDPKARELIIGRITNKLSGDTCAQT